MNGVNDLVYKVEKRGGRVIRDIHGEPIQIKTRAGVSMTIEEALNWRAFHLDKRGNNI